jgi:hypothetical protein
MIGDEWQTGPGWAGPPPGADPAETLADMRVAFEKYRPAPRECSKGWAKRCAASRGARCRCRCGGQNHGELLRQLAFEFDPPALADAARRP